MISGVPSSVKLQMKHDRPAGEQAGHDQRQRDAAELREAAAAEVLRRLLHGGVDVRQGGGHVEVHHRVEREGLEDDDAEVPRLPSQSIGPRWKRALMTPYCPRICVNPIAPTNGGRIIGTRIERGEELLAGEVVAASRGRRAGQRDAA